MTSFFNCKFTKYFSSTEVLLKYYFIFSDLFNNNCVLSFIHIQDFVWNCRNQWGYVNLVQFYILVVLNCFGFVEKEIFLIRQNYIS